LIEIKQALVSIVVKNMMVVTKEMRLAVKRRDIYKEFKIGISIRRIRQQLWVLLYAEIQGD
tara:strand:- start:177 stop:359 length:183 start_codon:yes stop_codon:yes gene_type:complete